MMSVAMANQQQKMKSKAPALERLDNVRRMFRDAERLAHSLGSADPKSARSRAALANADRLWREYLAIRAELRA